MLADQDIPEALVTPREPLSAIWLLPLVALLIGGWLFYKSQVEADIEVLIHFPTGQGLVAGKTEVRYQGIPIGRVEKFQLDDDLDGVVARVAFDRKAQRVLREGTQFWLIKPQVSLKGISGLDTLVSGEYISLRIGEGEPRYRFEALAEPPPLGDADPGLNITLFAETLGSIQYGSPVNYRQLQVGDVQGYELAEDGKGVLLQLNIRPQYADLVHSDTRFWNNSGIRLKGGLSGLKLQTDSLASLLIGGISFDRPANSPDTEPAPKGSRFKLYDNYEDANTGVLVRVSFDSAEGLEAGTTPVIFRGLKIGTVTKLDFEQQISKVIAELRLPPQAEAALNKNTRFWLVKPRLGIAGISGLDTLIKGNYIAVEPRQGDGGPVYRFEALPAPPVLGPGDPGLNITLTANTLGSLQYGSPVHYRQLQVGDVQGYQLSDDGQQVRIQLNIREQYAKLVKKNTRFWNNSGLRLKGSLSGLTLNTDSLASLLVGGINFDLPAGAAPAADATGDDLFQLYDNFEDANAGVLIKVAFDSGVGLEAGVTPIRLQGLTVGRVVELEYDNKLEQVIALIKLPPQTARTLTGDTRFWLIKPQVGLGGVSGLDTLIKGNYIEMAPGSSTGSAKGLPRQFTALKTPPRLDHSAPGLHLTLLTQQARGLSRGTPIYYRQIQVGTTQAVELTEQGQQVAVSIHIEPEYAKLVNRDSRFWNSSGLSVNAGLQGLKIESAPLRALLSGGISFDNPQPSKAPLVANGTTFTLQPDRRSALADSTQIRITFADAGGLSADAPIRYRGIPIGRVGKLSLNPNSQRVEVTALIDNAFAKLITADSGFWIVRPKLGLTATQDLDTLLSGTYLRLKPGRIRTGNTREFIGLEREPMLLDASSGQEFILQSPRLGSLKKEGPVYYRQVPVGRIVGFRLAGDARHVDIHISIDADYAALVREDTRFWNVSGVDVNFKLFGSTKIATESVESILAGGIALATPETTPLSPQASVGQRFTLHAEAKPEWRQWAPEIPLMQR